MLMLSYIIQHINPKALLQTMSTFLWRQYFLFQQENTSCHKAKIRIACITEEKRNIKICFSVNHLKDPFHLHANM